MSDTTPTTDALLMRFVNKRPTEAELSVLYSTLATLESENAALRKAIIAMAEDGWLYHGVEGMSDAQTFCVEAYRLITKDAAQRGGG